MNTRDEKLTRSAFWCGVLESDTRPVAAGVTVRTVRGTYTAFRATDRERTDEPARPTSQLRRV